MKKRLNRAYRWLEANPVTVAFVALALGAIAGGLGAYNAAVNRDQQRDINRVVKVQQTPCNRAPKSAKCAEQRLAVAKAEPIRNPCTSYQRVTGRRGRNCHRYFVDRDRHGAAEVAGPATGGETNSSEPTATAPTGAPGAAGSPPAAGGDQQQPSKSSPQPAGGGHGGTPPAGGDEPGPAPEAGPGPTATSPPPQNSTSSSTTNSSKSESTTTESTTTTTEPAGQGLLEGVGDVVESTGAVANETVEGLTEGTCRLLPTC